VWAGSALAAPFVNPPELFVPEWSTLSTHQRNIYWDFSSNPEDGPTSSGATGTNYESLLDSILWDSNYVEFVGDVQWFNPAIYTDERGGTIGIDHSGGLPGDMPLSGFAIFHIDNLPDSNPLKHIWLEIEAIQHLSWSLPYDLAVPRLNLPGGYETGSDFFIEDLEPFGERYRENDWWRVEPNPPWEEIVLDFFVLPGEEVYVDNFHIAGEGMYVDNFHVTTEGSEPIPEPSTILLLGCGALGLLGIAIRNHRKQKNSKQPSIPQNRE
jgi:hypothetical protein